MKKITNAIITYDTDCDTYDIKLRNPLSVCWQITTKCNLNCKYCLSKRVGNILEQPLEEIFANEIFDHPTHVLHYLQRRAKV